MLYDIRTTAAQIKRLGDWVKDGPDMADVELVADDRMLLAEQGDERMAWDTDGSPGSDEYLSLAPLDGPPREQLVNPVGPVVLSSGMVLTVQLAGTQHRIELQHIVDADGDHAIQLSGANCSLEGEMSGLYYPEAI